MKLITKVLISILVLVSTVFIVFGASSIKIDADAALVDEWKTLKGTNDAELTALVNNYLLEEIAKDKQQLMKTEYKEIGFYTSDVYSLGDVTEMNRIYGCVFP